MDIENPFHTAGTYRLMRLENIGLLVLSGGLMLWHANALNWWRALLAFWVIDIVGYLPGAVAYRRQGKGAISPIYHHIYNIAHTYLVVGAGVAAWAWALGGFEWAMLAVPFHLALDRGVFGNVFKPLALSFEPVPAPLYVVEAVLANRKPDLSKGDQHDA
jgi:hypothetical protein